MLVCVRAQQNGYAAFPLADRYLNCFYIVRNVSSVYCIVRKSRRSAHPKTQSLLCIVAKCCSFETYTYSYCTLCNKRYIHEARDEIIHIHQTAYTSHFIHPPFVHSIDPMRNQDVLCGSGRAVQCETVWKIWSIAKMPQHCRSISAALLPCISWPLDGIASESGILNTALCAPICARNNYFVCPLVLIVYLVCLLRRWEPTKYCVACVDGPCPRRNIVTNQRLQLWLWQQQRWPTLRRKRRNDRGVHNKRPDLPQRCTVPQCYRQPHGFQSAHGVAIMALFRVSGATRNCARIGIVGAQSANWFGNDSELWQPR